MDNVKVINDQNKKAEKTLQGYRFGIDTKGDLWFLTRDTAYCLESNAEMDMVDACQILEGTKVTIMVE